MKKNLVFAQYCAQWSANRIEDSNAGLYLSLAKYAIQDDWDHAQSLLYSVDELQRNQTLMDHYHQWSYEKFAYTVVDPH